MIILYSCRLGIVSIVSAFWVAEMQIRLRYIMSTYFIQRWAVTRKLYVDEIFGIGFAASNFDDLNSKQCSFLRRHRPFSFVTKRRLGICPTILAKWVDKNACIPLRWRHNGRDCVSNHQPYDCLLNRLFRRKSKKTSKLRVTGLCAGNSPGTGEFPAQMASYAENVSIWWRHHGYCNFAYSLQFTAVFYSSDAIVHPCPYF